MRVRDDSDDDKGPGGRSGGDALDLDWDGFLAQLAEHPREDGWVSLEEASRASGISRSTLRSWYRAGRIASRMIAGPNGPQRIVPLEDVVEQSLRSSRTRRQLEHARSLEAEIEQLRRRLDAVERHLGLS